MIFWNLFYIYIFARVTGFNCTSKTGDTMNTHLYVRSILTLYVLNLLADRMSCKGNCTSHECVMCKWDNDTRAFRRLRLHLRLTHGEKKAWVGFLIWFRLRCPSPAVASSESPSNRADVKMMESGAKEDAPRLRLKNFWSQTVSERQSDWNVSNNLEVVTSSRLGHLMHNEHYASFWAQVSVALTIWGGTHKIWSPRGERGISAAEKGDMMKLQQRRNVCVVI